VGCFIVYWLSICLRIPAWPRNWLPILRDLATRVSWRAWYEWYRIASNRFRRCSLEWYLDWCELVTSYSVYFNLIFLYLVLFPCCMWLKQFGLCEYGILAFGYVSTWEFAQIHILLALFSIVYITFGWVEYLSKQVSQSLLDADSICIDRRELYRSGWTYSCEQWGRKA